MENRTTIRQIKRFTIEYKSATCHVEFYIEPVADGVIIDPIPEKVISGENLDIPSILQEIVAKLETQYESVRVE